MYSVLLTLLFLMPLSAQSLTFATLNLARETDVAEIVRTVEGEPALAKADVLLFQEVAGQTKEQNVAEAVARKLGLQVAAVASAAEAPNQGLAILSRYPLRDVKLTPLKRYDLKFHSRVRFALAATVARPENAVRVWNVHLDSRLNAGDRLEQLGPVLEEMKAHRGPTLIGGDFNTTRFQWFLNVVPSHIGTQQARAVRGAFEAAGFQSTLGDEVVTFPFLGQHLDWIFVRGMVPEDSGTARIRFSDHYAVWARFLINVSSASSQ